MKQARLPLILAALLLGVVPFFGYQQKSDFEADETPSGTIFVEEQARHTLESTVEIVLVAPRVDALGQPMSVSREGADYFQLIYDSGLGTAVRAGDRNVIVTHNHWCELTPRLLYVVLRDAYGTSLAFIEPNVFRSSILYRDRGTMVFLAPESVLVKDSAVAPPVVPVGALLQVVCHDPQTGRLQLKNAWAVSSQGQDEPTSFRLSMESTAAIAPGDSGAGIWYNGQLVGNLWSVVEEQVQDWNEGRFRTPRPTAQCVVAVLPQLEELGR